MTCLQHQEQIEPAQVAQVPKTIKLKGPRPSAEHIKQMLKQPTLHSDVPIGGRQ